MAGWLVGSAGTLRSSSAGPASNASGTFVYTSGDSSATLYVWSLAGGEVKGVTKCTAHTWDDGNVLEKIRYPIAAKKDD